MLTADQLRVLRREAADALKTCQQLEGFDARFATLPLPPPPAQDWDWSTVTEVCLEGEASVVRWEDRPVSEIEPLDPDFVERARASDRIRRGPGDVELVGVPTRPTAEHDPALDDYCEAVRGFAADFVFGAEWSPRATTRAASSARSCYLKPRSITSFGCQ